jgi:hypothetical protein
MEPAPRPNYGRARMRCHPALLLLPLLLLTIPAARADDVQVPFDAEGRLEQLDAGHARAWGLLTEYPALEEARLYEDTDSGAYTLEVTERREGRSVRRRVPLSAEQVEALRRQVSEHLAAAPAPTPPVTQPTPTPTGTPGAPALNQEGRWTLIAVSGILGTSFYGWAVPVGLQAQSGSVLGLYTVTAGVSFFTPLFLTAGSDVTWGMAAMYYAGASRGPLHGLLLGLLVSPDQVGPQVLLASVGMGIAEGVAGTLWARSTGMSAGTANAMLLGSDFGLGYGVGLYALTTGLSPTASSRIPAAAALLGAAGGAVGGYYLAGLRGYTWGEAEAIRTAGLLGAFVTLPIFGWAELTDARAVAGLLMTGSALGLVLGDHFISGRGYQVGQAVLLNFGTVVGGLVGLGAVALLAPAGADGRVFLTASALGAVGGFAATYALLGPASSQQHASASVQLHFDPLALVGQLNGRDHGTTTVARASPPLVSVGGTF